jgi:hypothetical protein
MFAADLNKAFYGFEPDFFKHNLVRIADDTLAGIQSRLESGTTMVDICYFQKPRRGLLMKRVTANGK